jgi:hypothetical protein
MRTGIIVILAHRDLGRECIRAWQLLSNYVHLINAEVHMSLATKKVKGRARRLSIIPNILSDASCGMPKS